MGAEPPFIYDRTSTYTFAGPTNRHFNPKAATQASWVAPSPTPKKNGPLIDFNRHPDSYLIVPYGNLNVKPMNPKTKSRVINWRRLQLFLRLCALLDALGSLFCVIAINKTKGSVGWIVRVAPAVALIQSLYAVYHLSRSANGRTPASTASYMLFAVMIDTGLIPFLVFSALMAHGDYTSNAYGWSTLFGTDVITYKIIYSFFLLCVVEASLMVLSLALGIYLATLFRKIAKLPPDMNPLEKDNLTARPNHKRNKSELAKDKHLSGSTISLSNTADPMIAGTRRVPFLHTRTDSADSITLYGNESARNSKLALEEKEERKYRKSQLSVDVTGVSRPGSAVSPAANSRPAGSGLDTSPIRSEITPQQRNKKTSSWLSWATADPECQPRQVSGYAAMMLNDAVPPPLPVSRSHTPDIVHNETKNWFERSPRISQTNLSVEQYPMSQPSFQDTQHSDLQVPPLQQAKKRSREPLGMNPPTPRAQQFEDENENVYIHNNTSQHTLLAEPTRQALQETHANTVTTPRDNSRPSSFIGSGGKTRFYGNLRRSISSLSQKDIDNQREDDDDDDVSVSDYSRTRTMDSEHSHIEVYGGDEDEYEYELDSQQQQQWNGARQVSNSTGYDLHAGYAGLGAEFGRGMGRRREVSGKVAEEGRVDGGHTAEQQKKSGAAGWARFKGL